MNGRIETPLPHHPSMSGRPLLPTLPMLAFGILLCAEVSVAAPPAALQVNGIECLSGEDVSRMQQECLAGPDDSAACDTAAIWFGDHGEFLRQDCDLAAAELELAAAISILKDKLRVLDAEKKEEMGGFPMDYPLLPVFETAQLRWRAYQEAHCNDSTGPGATVALEAQRKKCLADLTRTRTIYVRQHWALSGDE